MAKHSSKRKTTTFHFPRMTFLFNSKLILSLILLLTLLTLALGAWYTQLPEIQKNEFARLIHNWGNPNKAITFWDVMEDCYYFQWGDRGFSSKSPLNDTLFSTSTPVKIPDIPIYPFTELPNNYIRVGYSDVAGTPSWVAYELFDVDTPTHLKRPSFKTDKRTRAQIRPDDYTRTGYDRGHMAPNSAIAQCYGKKGQAETFLMSNIVPQKHKMNAGVWKNLEVYEFQNLAARYGKVWIITGPVFYHRSSRLKINEKIIIPRECFKIIVMKNARGYFSRAYLIPNDVTYSNPENYRVSIDQIEKVTGLDFLSELPDDLEFPLEQAL